MIPLLLYDENMPHPSHRLLVEAGYDVKLISGELSGITDREVVDLAIQERRIIVTFDSDFGTLVFRYGLQPPGVISFVGGTICQANRDNFSKTYLPRPK